jgi:hypothetical protein
MSPCKPTISCLRCRIRCYKYRISNNDVKIKEYENLAKTCKFFAFMLSWKIITHVFFILVILVLILKRNINYVILKNAYDLKVNYK